MAQKPEDLVDLVGSVTRERITKPAAAGSGPETAPPPPAPDPGGDSSRERSQGKAEENTLDTSLARMIDHTQLRASASRGEILALCEEAREYRFYSVCVNSANVPICVKALLGSETIVCAVVGFPLGAMSPAAKAYEASEAVRAGASEVDMVMNIGALKSKDYVLVLADIRAVVEAARPAGVKVILETSTLGDEEKFIACALAKVGGARFVKTSTGFGGGGATADDVALMKRIVGDEVEVKASGGIRTREDALTMVKAGATRLGASASVEIVTGRGGESSARGY